MTDVGTNTVNRVTARCSGTPALSPVLQDREITQKLSFLGEFTALKSFSITEPGRTLF